MFFIRPFTDPVIVLSICLCCHCLFVVFLSWSKSVCFLYVHSLTLLLYCLHVYAVIVFLWYFWVGVNLYVFYMTIHWLCYCTVYMFMLSLFFWITPLQKLNSTSLIQKPYTCEWSYKIHTDSLLIKKGAVVAVIVWSLNLQLPMQSVPITTDVVGLSPA
jgi:hypothetical protein